LTRIKQTFLSENETKKTGYFSITGFFIYIYK